MATIGGLSGNTSSGVSMYGTSIKGYGGLASGLDTDSLIQGMTVGTRTKIQELLKKKTKYSWQTDAYRSVSDQLVKFEKKYLNIASKNSPARASFFDKSLVSILGDNSKYVSVTGASGALENMSITSIKQLAKDASVVTDGDTSIKALNTGGIKFGEDQITNILDGKSLSFTYGSDIYSVSLTSGKEIEIDDPANPGTKIKFTTDFSTPAKAVESLNHVLENTALVSPATGKLGDKLKVGLTADNKLTLEGRDTAGNSLYISGGADVALKLLGFYDADGKIVGGGTIPDGGTWTGSEITESLQKTVPFAELMAGKEITFNLNGVNKTIKMPDKDTINGWCFVDGDPTNTDPTNRKNPSDSANSMASYLNTEMEKAFGKNKVAVSVSGSADAGGFYGLSFKTMDTTSSVFRISSASDGFMGEKGLLGITYSQTNRLNMDAAIGKSGLKGLPSGDDIYLLNYDGSPRVDADGNKLLNLKVNGVQIEGLTEKSSMSDIVRAVNSSSANVKMSYLESADRFSLTSTIAGAAGSIEFDDSNALSKAIFGTQGSTPVVGRDAVLTVSYGGGSSVEISRDSNTFSMDGSTFTLSGTFNESAPSAAGAVTFSTSVDADKVAKTIGEMVNDYNEMIKTVKDLVSKRPDRSYGPLTDDEKSQLSADEIKKLEDKAKEGILFNDSQLSSLSSKLRTVFSGVADIGTLDKLGITVGGTYGDDGKIIFDEETFKAALKEDPDQVKNLFTKPSTDTDAGGISVRFKAVTDQFAKYLGTPKGSLIEKAGSVYASGSGSITNNALKKLMDDIDDDVDVLKSKLQTEINRYTRQFSQLEQLISQMNSQSSWLSQSMGG